MNTERGAVGALLLVFVLLLAACNREPLFKRESFVFGTRVEVLVWGESERKAAEAVAAVLQEFDRLHREFHAWQSSQLTRLNESIAAGHPATVSPELAQLIRDAQAVSARGDHLFDPGIGGLVKLWGFQGENFAARLPDAAALEEFRRAKPSIADLEVNGMVVSSRNRFVALDFGGYLKGVALDRAAAMLHDKGIDNALINIGGNIIALGSKQGAPWRVGIQHPRRGEAMVSLALQDGEAIGTSGDYQRFFELDGHRYCHLIDPRSGMPADATQSLSVLIPPGPQAGMRSDAASKPLFIAGETWRAMALQTGVTGALRVDARGQAEATPEMRRRLKIEMPDMVIREVP